MNKILDKAVRNEQKLKNEFKINIKKKIEEMNKQIEEMILEFTAEEDTQKKRENFLNEGKTNRKKNLK